MSDTENIEQNNDLNDDELEAVSGGIRLLPGMEPLGHGHHHHWNPKLGVCR
jgi:hypothetical protein